MKKYMKPCVELNAVNFRLNINAGSIKDVTGADGLTPGGDYEEGDAVDSKQRGGWSEDGLW